MNEFSTSSWRARAHELGLDPQEVKNVSSRYDMYRSYHQERGSDTLPLDRWYRWYRVEKLSDGHAMLAPPEPGCSVGSEVVTDGPIVTEEAFYQLLLQYRDSR